MQLCPRDRRRIRRAFATGTRDSTGRPGRNYWQLRTDYTIQFRLEAGTGRLVGRETVVIHNRSGSALRTIALRLDPNIFRPTAQRGSSTPSEATDGMAIFRLAADGVAADLTQPAVGGRGGGGAPIPGALRVSGLSLTNATIFLPAPIPAGGFATLEVEWHHKLPGGPG